MSVDFLLPDLGEGLTESEIVSWRVHEGDTVSLNQIIADVETAKAVVELPSPYDGRVVKLYAQPGTTVEVGEPIVAFELADAASGNAEPAPDAESPAPNLVGYGAKADAATGRRRRAGAGFVSAPTEAVTPGLVAPERAEEQRPRSTPPVRKLAHDLGVDLASLAGSGPDGLITRGDVERAASVEPTASAGAASTGARPGQEADRVTRTPVHGVRKHTAAAMVASAFTAPQVTEFLTVDVTETMALIGRLKADRVLAEHRIGILAIVAKALCIAVGRNPTLNTHWDDDAHEIVQYHYVNLGIAAATERGLVVPNIPDAEALTLPQLADAISDLAQTARTGRTTPERLRGGTITITNIGVFGIDAGTPMLNPGEAAILAMGAVRREPREHEGAIALREVLTLSLSFDHRLVDGEQGSRFLADIGAILRDPARTLAMV